MEPFLWLMIIAVIGSFIWLARQLTTLSKDTQADLDSSLVDQTIQEKKHKKDSTEQPHPDPPIKIEQDPESEIKYD